jgi:hypothetical protein
LGGSFSERLFNRLLQGQSIPDAARAGARSRAKSGQDSKPRRENPLNFSSAHFPLPQSN